MRLLLLIICIGCSVFNTCSCNRSGGANKKSDGNGASQHPRQRGAQIFIATPKNNQKFALGAEINLSVTKKEAAPGIDSIRWFINGKQIATTTSEAATLKTSELTTGTHRIEAIAHYRSGLRDLASASIMLLAAKPPKEYTYKIVKTYPHDPKAYTQGLLYDGGVLYESTGVAGESTVRKVEIQTGRRLQISGLPTEMFGEGLALVDNRLIQLTWKNQVAFVHRKDDFKLLNRINYTITEGWGLTYDGTHLLMTDGSATLYFMDKEHLTEVRRLEVCNDKGRVAQLNELEYINGELWANVYLTDNILRIDPVSGVVLGRVNMEGLLKPNDRTTETDVLNGIAYDSKTGKIYVTGKYWPKLFEIQVVD